MFNSLPEQRLLMGKAPSLSTQPFNLGVDDHDIARFQDRALEVYHQNQKFSTTERDQILARLVLGL